jgi:hypothetical protein
MQGGFAAQSFNGSIELEQRFFWQTSKQQDLSKGQTSVRLEAEYFTDWNDGKDQLIFEPLLRLDGTDEERTHVDIRQLLWSHLGANYEVYAGMGRVYWGVTESQHLVDIINQTDGVENIDGEDKLGQAMLRYSYYSDFGNLDLFLLPYFRTRTFSGPDSRLNGGFITASDNAVFQSNDGKNHLDSAVRYSNTFSDLSLGISWFSGTSREPDLFRFFDVNTATTTPYYPLIDQFGLDLQLTTDAWLIKLEAIQRYYDADEFSNFAAATAGIEYTFVGVFSTVYDVGALLEYSWDQRDLNATSLFQNDLFLGARLALNDMSDSEVLLGIVQDLDESSSRSLFLEAATRLDTNLSANIELRYFHSDQPQDLLFRFRDDSFIQIGLEYFF